MSSDPRSAGACTVGAVFLRNQVLLFKNRDLGMPYITRHVYTFETNRLFRALRGVNLADGCPAGVSIGVNRHGIGVANTHVASSPNLAYDVLCEEILQSAKTSRDIPRIVEAFVRKNALQGGRIIACGLDGGYLIEVYNRVCRIQAVRAKLAITNHFTLISHRLQGLPPPRPASQRRERIANLLLKPLRGTGQLKSLLRSHLPEKGGNSICRHGVRSATESSHIIAIGRQSITWASLVGNPCEHDYQTLDVC